MTPPSAPPLRDIVLLGGGHAHIRVLKILGMRPEPGLRLTIIAREPHSPYSGMLPGLIAGHYTWDDAHVDLARLAAFAGARFIPATATGLDLAARRVVFEQRPPLRYDLLSINTGGVPGERFASAFVTPVKPIGRFLPAWRQLVAGPSPPRHLTIVGAGAGGVELALAIAHRHPHVATTLLDAGPRILADLAPAARRRLLAALAAGGIELLVEFQVVAAADGRVIAADGRAITTDHVLWVTGVEAPQWPSAAGLATDDGGFIAVNAALQSTSHPQVFAAGDVAALVAGPRPKSGVYAVRQGPVLAANLRRLATGRRPRAFRAQRRTLAIVALGDRRAVASRGRWYAAGAWAWRWKRWIDSRFMRQFSDLPEMPERPPRVAPGLREAMPDAMRCGGCGAKLSADVLARVLHRLEVTTSAATVRGIGDDAAIIQVAAGDIAVSCDGFRAMIDDGYRFGRIGAHHALNDLFAMGARPAFALVLATVPTMAGAMMEEDLFQIMSGALAVFRDHAVDLVGGHSAEGAELGIAFSVTGALGGPALAKGGLLAGQRLLLSKPLGTGAVLAGAMRGRARAADLIAAIDAMDTSNAAAAEIFRAHGATGCTDVSGFGLAGHLSEMTRGSGVGARLYAAKIPSLAGAHDLIAAGTVSSLQTGNELALTDFVLHGLPPNAVEARLLADPQTSGGLLAGVPEHRAGDCLAELRRQGYPDAAVVGEVVAEGLQIVA